MLYAPHFNPIAFHIIGFPVHWYGMMYLISFIVGCGLACYRARTLFPSWSNDVVFDLLFYIVLGVIIGGRLGYVLFYNFKFYWYHPKMIIEVWYGGMSFHGGLLGVILATYIWARRKKYSFWAVTDFIAPIVPIGLAAGRIGNFINGELWGRLTTVPWGMVYPNAGPYPRHPSQLYEFFLEGVVLFLILWFFSRKKRPKMATSGLFLLLYGCFRFICEFFRNPDPQLGFVAFGWLTRGQELSVPMILLGAVLIFVAYDKSKKPICANEQSIEKTTNHDDSKDEV